MTDPRKILVIQTAFLGDVVFSTSLLVGIRRRYPDAAITVLASPRGGGILAGQPFVDEILLYDKTGREKGAGALLGLLSRLRSLRLGGGHGRGPLPRDPDGDGGPRPRARGAGLGARATRRAPARSVPTPLRAGPLAAPALISASLS